MQGAWTARPAAALPQGNAAPDGHAILRAGCGGAAIAAAAAGRRQPALTSIRRCLGFASGDFGSVTVSTPFA